MVPASPTGPDAWRGGLFDEICAAMPRPVFYAHDPRDVQLRQTAIPVVFVAGKLVYKLKRPVGLPFC